MFLVPRWWVENFCFQFNGLGVWRRGALISVVIVVAHFKLGIELIGFRRQLIEIPGANHWRPSSLVEIFLKNRAFEGHMSVLRLLKQRVCGACGKDYHPDEMINSCYSIKLRHDPLYLIPMRESRRCFDCWDDDLTNRKSCCRKALSVFSLILRFRAPYGRIDPHFVQHMAKYVWDTRFDQSWVLQ